MTEPQIAPYGAWKSPITAERIAAATISLSGIGLDGADTYWLEGRPSEEGRYVLVRRTPDGQTADVTPPPFNVRTRVHEYGGGSYIVDAGTVYFANYADQRLYRQAPGGAPDPITPPDLDRRYADAVVDHSHGRLIAVREDHTGAGEAVNTIVAVALAGGAEDQVLVAGNDFYAAPRLSPDGRHLAWMTWRHPNMPWDGSEVWTGTLAADGAVTDATRVAGGPGESIFQPEWSPDGVLHFVSDRTGWWNLYRLHDGQIEPLCPLEAEFGAPQWVFRMATYGFAADGTILCLYSRTGTWQMARLDPPARRLTPLPLPYTDLFELRTAPGRAVFLAGAPQEALAVVQLDLATAERTVLRRASALEIDPGYLSVPEAITFPTEHGLSAHAFYYAPGNPDYAAPPGARPPLIVISHGGPTSASGTTLNLAIQFWTSRGFAVLDVNYGGSTGYGRAYRERLNGQWGVVDVDDCVNGARALVARGAVDGDRLAIRGGSAGGYTTLCALTFRKVFKAGASYFGLSDLTADALETHKFESRYSHSVIGPYPEQAALYRERSPVHFADQLTCPVIFFQGLEDQVVLPNQTELMVNAMRARHIPVAYLPFAGEQHGFRRAENIQRSLEAELYFYGRIFGFAPADVIAPVEIENLDP